MKRHRWPGNVRELENLARRLAALYPQETDHRPLWSTPNCRSPRLLRFRRAA
jgi:DNA-binding NtrC family response regulator